MMRGRAGGGESQRRVGICADVARLGVTVTSEDSQVTVSLIVAVKECPKCRKCEAMIGRLLQEFPDRIDYRKVRGDSPEAEEYGVIMPPMMVLDGVMLAAGRVPRESKIRQLVADRLGGGDNA